MRIFAAGLSDAGVTRATNDDHYCIGPFVEQGSLTSLSLDTASVSFQRHGLLAAVADGMGSYAGGAIASRILLETLSALFYGQQLQGNTPDELREQLAGCLQQAQEVLRAYLLRDEKLHEAGTTLAGLVLLPPDICLVFHLGDSRVLREAAGYVRQLTVDHTLFGQDIADGRLTEAEVQDDPARHQLTHSCGMAIYDPIALAPNDTFQSGCQYFIGTDGWHGLGQGLTRQNLQQLSHRRLPADALAQQMLRGAFDAGSSDNATVIVIQLGEESSDHGK